MTSQIDTTFCGDVDMEDFDEGIYNAMDRIIVADRPYVPASKFPNMLMPIFDETHGIPEEVGNRMPGIPIIWSNPDDSVQRYNVPCFRITREDPSPALERWMGLHKKHRGPAPGATLVQVTKPNGEVIEGWSKYEEQQGAWPEDIPYTVTAEATGIGARTNAQRLLKFLRKAFPPYAVISVPDSRGALRKYNVFVEGPSELSEVADIRDRAIIYALSLRVSGEADLSDRQETKVVTQAPVVNTYTKV